MQTFYFSFKEDLENKILCLSKEISAIERGLAVFKSNIKELRNVDVGMRQDFLDLHERVSEYDEFFETHEDKLKYLTDWKHKVNALIGIRDSSADLQYATKADLEGEIHSRTQMCCDLRDTIKSLELVTQGLMLQIKKLEAKS